ncbi:copper amine oxidase N-terminal domain-containing protein [Paenibacillus paeoniae]|uniref:Copper amine oxidase N-terminal domain-containing protein n=1 Tax=Paenibacillus paeoniae TaxID=2292705 RepID=A0A371PMC9_9BACL|nr:copper amine oxidase N-terminal domain-containing protein [Paenibacillus paeoniae]REK76809.1 copper amine oxidase N-terminal domain-containing protein [Paenibacillus paeoniae]
MKNKSLAKLLLAVLLAAGVIVTGVPSDVQASVTAVTKIDNATKAIAHAQGLNLIPDGARAAAKQNGDKWEVTFKNDEEGPGGGPLLYGTIVLYAKTGKVASYATGLKQSNYNVQPGGDPDDESVMTYSIEESITIATDFIKQQDWKLEDSWVFNPYPLSENSTKFDAKQWNHVRFDRSHDGIRDSWDEVSVTVDRWRGEVVSYYVDWEERIYTPNKGNQASPISLYKAGQLFYDVIEPLLIWQGVKDPNQPELVYALHDQYVMAIDGTIPSEYQRVNPPLEENIKPAYSSKLAKKRLLAMYDLNLEYINGNLAYRLRLQPEITFFMDGWHPTIDADSGKWLNFLNDPILTPFPPAGEWLVHAAPAGKIGYDAAILWNNELLPLENEPFIRDGYTLVPFRELLEKLGAKITWNAKERKVTASKEGTSIELTVDSETAYINGNAKKLDAPARLKNGRTYIPARLVLEAFGLKVGWNNESRLVLVGTKDQMPVPTQEELKRHRFQAQLNWENKALH